MFLLLLRFYIFCSSQLKLYCVLVFFFLSYYFCGFMDNKLRFDNNSNFQLLSLPSSIKSIFKDPFENLFTSFPSTEKVELYMDDQPIGSFYETFFFIRPSLSGADPP